MTGIDGLFTDYSRMVFSKQASEGKLVDWEKRLESIEDKLGDRKTSPPVPRAIQDRPPSLIAIFLLIKVIF